MFTIYYTDLSGERWSMKVSEGMLVGKLKQMLQNGCFIDGIA